MSPIHLLVLVHGMWGNPVHLAELLRIIQDVKAKPLSDGTQLRVLVAKTNSDDSTYDGIDWGGERVAEEISDMISSIQADGDTVAKFSITGYSLGGLISRYVVGILFQRGFFDTVTPVNFNTFATPHIGLLKRHPIFATLASTLGPTLLSRTGEQFYCVDKWAKSGKPLLEVMSDPGHIFYKALSKFQSIRVYANALNDITVPYVTASIEFEDPFALYETNGLQVDLNESYSSLITSYSLPDEAPPPVPKPKTFTRAWFARKMSWRLPFPIRLSFPLNILVYAMIPILLPTLLSLALIRLTLASRSSRARIKALENDSKTERLVHIISRLEKELEETVADIIDNADTAPLVSQDDSTSLLTPVQRRMVMSLNKLPIKKERAFFPNVRNSHAMIVSRDIKRFDFHKLGEPVIRHWADSFVL